MNKKVLLVTDWAPPMLDGPSIILGNILRELNPAKVILFTRERSKQTKLFIKRGNEVNVKRYTIYVPSPYSIKYSSLLRRIVRILEVITIPLTTLKGLIVALREKPDCILATSDIPHGHFMIAAYFMALILRKRLYFYLFDPVEEFASSKLHKALLKYFEPRMFAYASKIITMNNYLAEHYEKKYALKCKVLHHSVVSSKAKQIPDIAVSRNGDFKIVFSGTVSKYQLDALVNLRKAIDLIRGKINLLIYTPTSEATVREYGFIGSNIVIKHIDYITLKYELKKADILFLPLSFENADSIVVKAAFPSKTMDYLAAGRPIIVHAPLDCFIIEYAKERGFAEIVTNNSIASLANAISLLSVNKDRQRKLIRNSCETLLEHSSKQKYKELISILEVN